ncbi:MAG: 30S ribosomal protein S17 [Dissulfurimicrobium sp.]|uniref:30S ribosomal protein S17 n=1 Tax=Dissulfurimicrobium TaxID=1769732 RepID=UPI001EDBADD0|nr:30S ribosomal protein S17 [Dissulfurimicrobium hydrothermale]UKL14328.1 30S ribosomal protein S17 [Dissulfurimicrobium hydrothermale]
MESVKKQKKTFVGIVASNKMDKTVVIIVNRRFKHPIYGKYIQHRKKYMAHDPHNSCNIGDKILIEESKPISRRKRWIVREILEKAV